MRPCPLRPGQDGPVKHPKPYSHLPGYHCSLKTRFGHVVVCDLGRNADPRWLLRAFEKGGHEIGTLNVHTEREARCAMKAARDGCHDWIPEPERPRQRLANGRHAFTMQVGEGGRCVEMEVRNGVVLPRFPNDPAYMRGWNRVIAHRQGKGPRYT